MKKKQVAVAMSGGVDSSVAAALLLEEGFEVQGITMKLCPKADEKAVADAAAVCGVLGIEHRVVDFRERFEAEIIRNFLQEYSVGRTPNPCVLCNQKIKFGALWDAMQELGADYLATGHFARVEQDAQGIFRLRRASYIPKDQSYVLYHLDQEKLGRVIFPLGTFSKDQVRALAEKFRLPVFNKKESQDICFIPDGDYHSFLAEHGGKKDHPGDFVNLRGEVLGRHKGISHYTVGQRKGLGIAAEEPLYVIALDVEHNRVVLGFAREAGFAGLEASNIFFNDDRNLTAPLKCRVKIRYNAALIEATVIPAANAKARVEFVSSLKGVAPGQTVVFYDGETCLGGGMIEKGYNT